MVQSFLTWYVTSLWTNNARHIYNVISAVFFLNIVKCKENFFKLRVTAYVNIR